MNEKVTWLLAVKNGMPYLPETLASIEAQTYRNWEVLAWDNGSNDGTVEELQRWIPSRLPGAIVVDQPMKSLGACRAEMTKQCRTDLCACIDADDVNLPERLEQQVAFLLAHPQVALVGSQITRLDSRGVDHGLFYPLPTRHDDIVHTMLYENPIAQPTVLFRRGAVLEVGSYRDVGQINVEDYDLWLRVAARHRLANLNYPLLKYRVHDKSTTQIALGQNRLSKAVDDRFCQCAPALFGCGTREAKLLRARRHRCALVAFYNIAKHLEITQGGSWVKRLRSPSFARAARRLTSRRDFLSGFVMAALAPDKKALPLFLMLSLKEFLVALGMRRIYKMFCQRKGTS